MMWSFILDLIFPKFCVGCGKFDTLLCDNCYLKINFTSLALNHEIKESYLKKTFVMAEYEGITKKLITTLKYQSVKNIGQTLAEIIFLATDLPDVDIITSVPLHPKKYNQRGFNQATEIATSLSQLTRAPFKKLLTRTKHTSPQAKIKNKNDRLTHLQNVFALNKPQPDVESVLIIDDVSTTGTTLNESAKVLYQAGVKNIYGLVVAHGS